VPSRNAPTAIASFTSARVLLSNSPADWVTSPERLDGLHNGWVTLLEVLITCWYLSLDFAEEGVFMGQSVVFDSAEESFH
jgi:hypothetical protein